MLSEPVHTSPTLWRHRPPLHCSPSTPKRSPGCDSCTPCAQAPTHHFHFRFRRWRQRNRRRRVTSQRWRPAWRRCSRSILAGPAAVRHRRRRRASTHRRRSGTHRAAAGTWVVEPGTSPSRRYSPAPGRRPRGRTATARRSRTSDVSRRHRRSMTRGQGQPSSVTSWRHCSVTWPHTTSWWLIKTNSTTNALSATRFVARLRYRLNAQRNEKPYVHRRDQL